jgi:hypothetical protein
MERPLKVENTAGGIRFADHATPSFALRPQSLFFFFYEGITVVLLVSSDIESSVTLTTWHPLTAKVGNTSPTSGGRSVGIVRSRTHASEFSFLDIESHCRIFEF